MKKSKIGIIGGGQLALFMILEARNLDIRTYVVCFTKQDPALHSAFEYHISTQSNTDDTIRFLSQCESVTIDTENIPSYLYQNMYKITSKIYPSLKTIDILKNRKKEKMFIRSLGIPTVDFTMVSKENMQSNEIDRFIPGIIKTATGGYDGKGQKLVHNKVDVFRHINNEDFDQKQKYILEKKIDIKKEFSIILCGSKDNTFAYPPTINCHENGILRCSMPTKKEYLTEKSVYYQAQIITLKMFIALEYEGIMTIEFFEDTEGNLLVNEIAPRVHNSGHWTLDAGCASQFEQNIRIISGMPIRRDHYINNTIMYNIIGNQKIKNDVGRIYLYGKKEREGRKIGHINYQDENCVYYQKYYEKYFLHFLHPRDE